MRGAIAILLLGSPFVAPLLRAQVVPAPGARLAPIVPQPDALHEAGRNVTISLLTMGNGEQVWELFGHAAIWIHDDVTNRDTVFNWGVFDQTQPLFIPHFLQGLMLYQMGGDTMDQLLYAYRYFNRSVVSQQLDLTPAQKDSLLRLIQINAMPENRQYRYDYYVDNCSTRPRDLLDRVLGGRLHAAATMRRGRSYRWHTLRLMQGDKPLVLGVDIGLGEPSDREITIWDEMFLPRILHDVVAGLQVQDSSGATRPLVKSERTLFQATRPPEPEGPPNLAPWLTAMGLVIAGMFAGLATKSADSRVARIALGVTTSLWCSVSGILGVILALLWTVTDHTFAHANENLLVFNPLWLILAVLVPITVVSGRAKRATRDLGLAVAVLCLFALIAHLALLSRQVNLAVIGLTLPPALAIAWVFRRD